MGRLFTSPRTKLFLIIIVRDLFVIISTAFPVIPVSSSEVMFVLKDISLENGTYAYRWFDLEAGNSIHIDFTASREVDAYIFSKTQFTDYSNVEYGPSLDSSLNVESGKLDKTARSSGTYFFLIHNLSGSPAEVIYSKGTGNNIVKVTFVQILKGLMAIPEETGTTPYYQTVRNSPGKSSNS